MRERPLLFSGEMVVEILEGRKTKTRRAIQPQPFIDERGNVARGETYKGRAVMRHYGQHPDGSPQWENFARMACPYGKPGDRLWVREAVRAEELPGGTNGVRYVADNAFRKIENTAEAADRWLALNHYGKRRSANVPAIHMPRWACRLVLELTDVRVERLQDISLQDVRAEGVEVREFALFGANAEERQKIAAGHFAMLWTRINGAESWAANPYVWALSFRRLYPSQGDLT